MFEDAGSVFRLPNGLRPSLRLQVVGQSDRHDKSRPYIAVAPIGYFCPVQYGTAHGAQDGGVDAAFSQKADLGFGGVNVDIDLRGVDGDVDNGDGMPSCQ